MKTAVKYRRWWWGMIPWIMATGGFLAAAIGFHYWNHLFAVESQHTKGKILGAHYQVYTGRRGRPSYTYYVRYAYETQRAYYEKQTTVQARTWSQIHIGNWIPVKYLIDRPAASRIDYYIEDNYELLIEHGVSAVGLVILFVGVGSFWYVIWQNRVWQYLTREGLSCMGEITSVELKNVGRGSVRGYLILTFADNRGNKIAGRSWPLAVQEAWRWREGTEVKVYYDPKNPSLFTLNLSVA